MFEYYLVLAQKKIFTKERYTYYTLAIQKKTHQMRLLYHAQKNTSIHCKACVK